METFKWIFIICSILPFSARAELKCSDVSNCQCIQSGSTGEMSFVCPSENEAMAEVTWTSRPEGVLEVECMQAYFDPFNMTFVPSAEVKDLSFLPKIGVGNIQKITVKDCPSPDTFAEMKQLMGLNSVKEVALEYVNLTELKKDYFEPMSSNVVELRLQWNNLVNISRELFEQMVDLKFLEITNNRLNIVEVQFSSLTKLEYLHLQMNDIEFLPENAFDGLQNLVLLHLWSNELTFLDKNIFRDLVNLKSLELSHNEIKTVHGDLFSNLRRLEQLNLASNRLSNLPTNLFASNNNLKSLRLENNYLTSIPAELFMNKILLEKIGLSNCSLNNLPPNLFESSQNVTILNLQNNRLKHIPMKLFANLTKLQELNLQANNINEINPDSFKHLYSLREINLADNKIEYISEKVFPGSKDLRVLNLCYNRISNIDNLAFIANHELENVNLSHNSLDVNTVPEVMQYFDEVTSWFSSHMNLTVLDLSYNNLTRFLGDMKYKLNIKTLDLSHNQITSVGWFDFQTLSNSLSIDLSHNQITHVNLENLENITSDVAFNTVVDLNDNPITCDCQAYDLLRYFDLTIDPDIRSLLEIKADNLVCHDPPELAGKLATEVKPRMVTCSMQPCPHKCQCFVRPHNYAYIVDCVGKNLTEAPKLTSLEIELYYFRNIEVHLQNNFLKNLSLEGKGYENVTFLDLSNSSISNVSWLPRKMQVIRLHDNNITRLSYSVLDALRNVRNETTLYGNPWRCDCQALNFSQFVSENVNPRTNDIRCNRNGKQIRYLKDKQLCPTHEVAILSSIVVVISVLALIVFSFAIYYKYKTEIKVWCYAHNLCLWFVTEEDLDKDKQYDAFLSFTHVDEQYVEDLVMKLESGPAPYKICIHTRNWVIGEYIPKQIAQSVQNSRRTIVVLSQSFKDSIWSKMEFRTAHTQALTEGRARVIVIIKGDVDLENDVDDELKAYLKTNTYIKWNDPWFWDKLRYALPHNTHKKATNRKLDNVILNIDKMDLLNGNMKANHLTTPPVDPLLLKIDPLDFNCSQTPPAAPGLHVIT